MLKDTKTDSNDSSYPSQPECDKRVADYPKVAWKLKPKPNPMIHKTIRICKFPAKPLFETYNPAYMMQQ